MAAGRYTHCLQRKAAAGHRHISRWTRSLAAFAVDFHVNFHVSFLNEGCRTLVTFVGTFGAMDTHVSPELSIADKAEITLRALEWFYAIMDFLVVSKVIRFNETATNGKD